MQSNLRARWSADYAATPRWSLGARGSQDIVGRSGRAQLSTAVAYSWPTTAQTTINFGAGAHFGSRTYLNSNFGVPLL